MPTRKLSDCDQRLAAAWMEIEAEYLTWHSDRELILTCTYRPPEEQLRAFKQGRQQDADGKWMVVNPGIVITNADGSVTFSPHNYLPSKALDFAVLVHGKITWDDDEYEPVGLLGESHMLKWGGRWRRPHDCPHLELR